MFAAGQVKDIYQDNEQMRMVTRAWQRDADMLAKTPVKAIA